MCLIGMGVGTQLKKYQNYLKKLKTLATLRRDSQRIIDEAQSFLKSSSQLMDLVECLRSTRPFFDNAFARHHNSSGLDFIKNLFCAEIEALQLDSVIDDLKAAKAALQSHQERESRRRLKMSRRNKTLAVRFLCFISLISGIVFFIGAEPQKNPATGLLYPATRRSELMCSSWFRAYVVPRIAKWGRGIVVSYLSIHSDTILFCAFWDGTTILYFLRKRFPSFMLWISSWNVICRQTSRFIHLNSHSMNPIVDAECFLVSILFLCISIYLYAILYTISYGIICNN